MDRYWQTHWGNHHWIVPAAASASSVATGYWPETAGYRAGTAEVVARTAAWVGRRGPAAGGKRTDPADSSNHPGAA